MMQVLDFQNKGWTTKFSYTPTNGSYRISTGWTKFVAAHNLKAGDLIRFYKSNCSLRYNRYYINSAKGKITGTNMTQSEDISLYGSCKGQYAVVESENTKPLETKMIRLFGKDIYVECRGDINTIQASYEVKRVGNLGDDSRHVECIVSENENPAPCETERIRLFGKDIYVRMHK